MFCEANSCEKNVEIQKILFIILEPDPVNATASSFARNITVKWTEPNVFGKLKYYEVI